MQFFKFNLFFIVLSALSITGFSQTDSTYKLELEEVVVTATRKPGQSLDIPYSSSTKTKYDLEQERPRSFPEALMGVPGVFVQKTNHGGGSPFVRGLTGNQTLTLIDGVRLNNSTFRYGPNQYLNTIDLFTIEKVEVVKGSGSVQYGSDALGGVIQVFTKDPEFVKERKVSGNVLGKYMTQNMEKTVRGELEYGAEKFAVMAGYSYKNFGDLWGGDSTGKQSPSGYGENAFDVKLKFDLGNNWLLKAAHQTVMQKDVDVYHKVMLENYAISKMDPQNRHLNYIKLSKGFTHPYFKTLSIIASDQHTKEIRLNQKNNSTTLTTETDKVNTKGITAEVFNQWTESWTSNSGAEFYFDKVNSSKTQTDTETNSITHSRGLYPDAATNANLSVYSLHHFRYGPMVFEGGLRYNTFSISINDTTLGKVLLHPSALVANAGALWKINHQNSLYISYSSGFRAPNVDDMGTLGIVDFRYELLAYGLKPERANNFELGYKLRAGKLYSDVALFYNQLSNIITRQRIEGKEMNGYPLYEKVNSEKGYILGTDVEVGFNVVKNLDVVAVTSYTYGQNITKGEPIRRIPPMNKRVLINYHKEKWYAKAEWMNAKKQDRLAKGDTEDNRIPKGGTPAWNVFNLYGGYQFNKVLLNAGIQNILNEDYRYHGSGINAVGRSAWIGVSWRF